MNAPARPPFKKRNSFFASTTTVSIEKDIVSEFHFLYESRKKIASKLRELLASKAYISLERRYGLT